MSTETELLPCPFCGAEAQCKPDDYGSGGQHVPPHLAGCRACRVFMVEEDEADAIAAWNRRSAPPAWQDIATAPRDGAYILVTNERADGAWIAKWMPVSASGYRFDKPWFSVMLNHDHISRATRYLPPTHWMALPLPPHAEGGRDGTAGVKEQSNG